MDLVQTNPDLGEVKLLKKFLLNLSRCRRQGLFMNNPGQVLQCFWLVFLFE